MLADSCTIRIVNGCRSFKWGQSHSRVSHAKEEWVAISNSLLKAVLGLGELVSLPAVLCCELRSVFLLDILEYLRPWSTLAQQGGGNRSVSGKYMKTVICSSQEKTECICLVMLQKVVLQGKTSTQARNIIICGSLEKQSFAKCACHEMISNMFVSAGYPSARRGLLFLPWRLTDSAWGEKLPEVIGYVKWKRVKSHRKELDACMWRKDCVQSVKSVSQWP